MQLRTDEDLCTFPCKTWLIPPPLVSLNLTTFDSKSVDTILSNLSESALLDAFYRQSPWNRCWQIITVGKRSYAQHEHGRSRSVFIVHLKCSSYEKNPSIMTESIQQSLSKKWVIKTHLGTIYLSQNILGTGPPALSRHPTLNRSVLYPLWHGLPVSSVVSVPHLEILIIKDFLRPSFPLNKPLFCSLISLKADEYDILFTAFLIIRHISSQRLFYESEMVVRRVANEMTAIQVCLEDTDLEIIRNKVGAQHGMNRTYLLWLVFIMLIIRDWYRSISLPTEIVLFQQRSRTSDNTNALSDHIPLSLSSKPFV